MIYLSEAVIASLVFFTRRGNPLNYSFVGIATHFKKHKARNDSLKFLIFYEGL